MADMTGVWHADNGNAGSEAICMPGINAAPVPQHDKIPV
jgi:hypothetical protein